MEWFESLALSLIYDCLKAGVKYISRNYFEEKIRVNENMADMSEQKLDMLYDMITQIYAEVHNVHERYVTRDDLIDLIKVHIKRNDPENRSRNLKIYLERGDMQYQKKCYDSAIKQYEEALFYVADIESEAIIQWKIFTCYLMIDGYYYFAVECNGKCYDLNQIYNNNDYSDWRTVKDIGDCFGVGKYDASSIFSMLSGASCSIAKRKYVVSKNAYDIGKKAYSLTPNASWKEILDNCVIR